jgi:uncharacterized membrane protein
MADQHTTFHSQEEGTMSDANIEATELPTAEADDDYMIVGGWMGVNLLGFSKFDAYPFILLNLAFSLQAAYAAPLILLAQTRQADRDKVHSDADARHREDLAMASEQRQSLAAKQTEQLVALLEQNTQLTTLTQKMSERIEGLTLELHGMLKQRSRSA